MGSDDLDKLARGLTEAQRKAILGGRVHDCYVNHPVGTRCPNCVSWPFKKGGAAEFRLALKAHIERTTQ
ncbi:hypothetical protein UFOVP5_22 [uncultured Caudovirales phage]|uniref:Uncharacterized protein n=1 Tax=uncultured Caudovirales phage TaxID=2100421 RepID=A0A6J5KGZ8_9CAUD|nr:hypothetical protein UFOVP5_22 [uncultured Caudovirales phage]